MIISRTPLRVSLFGGGTDLPEYFNASGGAVIGSAVDKYIYHTVTQCRSELFNFSVRLSYSQVESVASIYDLEHRPAKEVLSLFGIEKDVEIHVAADLPAFSGLGSSSSFVVGLMCAVNRFTRGSLKPLDLAKMAIDLERNTLGEAVGFQDQTFASVGGFNLIEFSKNDEIKVTPIDVSSARFKQLNNSLLLFYTGLVRRASNVEREKISNMSNIRAELDEMRRHVDTAYDIITGAGSLDDIGYLLDETWRKKKLLTKAVSNPTIDGMYEIACSAGALGGKILGAGGGGFLLLWVPEENTNRVRKALRDFHEIDFNFGASGASIVYEE